MSRRSKVIAYTATAIPDLLVVVFGVLFWENVVVRFSVIFYFVFQALLLVWALHRRRRHAARERSSQAPGSPLD